MSENFQGWVFPPLFFVSFFLLSLLYVYFILLFFYSYSFYFIIFILPFQTPLHAALSKLGHPPTAEAIEAHAREHHPEFLATFDRNKPRALGRKVTSPDQELARSVFGEAGPSLEAIAERIKNGTSKKIVVLLGAGVRYLLLPASPPLCLFCRFYLFIYLNLLVYQLVFPISDHQTVECI
jgi:hypothetical protein